MTYGLTHIAIAVRDLERSLAFYRQVFNVETMHRRGGFLQVRRPSVYADHVAASAAGTS
jgi:catechol 2,3-dioxygenase-like lactoylglutathione lyase family enzyme